MSIYCYMILQQQQYMQYIPQFPTVSQYLISLLILCSFNRMLAHDPLPKKTVFALTLLSMWAFLSHCLSCAGAAALLMRVIAIQIGGIGLYMGICDVVLRGCRGRRKQEYNLCVVLAILISTSICGALYSIVQAYHRQLFHRQIIVMLPLVILGFIVVYVGDLLHNKYMQNNNGNRTNKGSHKRRKIFHIVPVIVLPVLSLIHYPLFTLMAMGSFYLFWMLEIIRYFGKIALKQKQQDKIVQREQTASINVAKIVRIVNEIDRKIHNTQFIKWMDQLNSQRQPYFWYTHLSLILGLCSTYIFYQPSDCNECITNYKQHISIVLVLSDAAAAIIGKKYGTHTVPYANKKTLQGFLAYALTAFILQLAIFVFLSNSGLSIDYLFIMVTSIACATGQLYSGDLDNIICPMLYILVDVVYGYVL